MYFLKTAATSEPVSVSEAKTALKVTGSDEDTYIGNLITAAREKYEGDTLRQLMEATWTLKLSKWPTRMLYLERVPVTSVESVKYYNADGELQEMTANEDYCYGIGEPGRLTFANRYELDDGEDKIEIEFKAGAGSAEDVMEVDKQAILMLVAHWYENRETVVTGTIVSKVPLAYETLVENRRLVTI